MKTLIATLCFALLAASAAAAHQIVVHPGQSIQAAVDFALPGDVIVVQSGVYHEAGRPCQYDYISAICAVVIDKHDISLIASSPSGKPVILNNPGGLDVGIDVVKDGADANHCEKNGAFRLHGSKILGFTVSGFKGTGIVLECVDDWELGYDTAGNNAVYGLYPVKVGRGRAHHNVATGSNDTGLYVGQSHEVRIDHNLVYGNVSGYEFENTTYSQLDHNEAFNNTGGILEFLMPGLDVMANHDNVISDNFVHANNRKNTCLGGDVCLVPSGTGLLLVTGDNNQTVRNTVTSNKTYGIALADACTAFMIPPPQCKALPFNPNPRNSHIEFNTSILNGIDLIWTGTGRGNCWFGNRARTSLPSPLPSC